MIASIIASVIKNVIMYRQNNFFSSLSSIMPNSPISKKSLINAFANSKIAIYYFLQNLVPR